MEPKKVLIVDDVKDLSDALLDLVEFKGFKGITASNGAEGIEVALREHPDLILLDYRMPDMNGFDVMRKLRQDEWGKTVRIIFLTASQTPDDIPEDLDISPEDILNKSTWGIENLGKKIEEELNIQQ